MFQIIIGWIVAAMIGILYLFISDPANAHPDHITQNETRVIGGRQVIVSSKQRAVAREYARYKAPKTAPTFEEFCFPRKYKLQRQQLFMADFMKPVAKPKEALVFHNMGAGKTCLAIQVMKRWCKRGKPLIVMPAALIPGFRAEMRSPCGGLPGNGESPYAMSNENPLVPGSREYNDALDESDNEIDRDYHIMSFNKFAESGSRINAPLIIVDEVQNVSSGDGAFFGAIIKWIEAHSDATVMIMSGTPIFDSIAEIYSLARMLRIKSEAITPKNIPRLFDGKVSYFAGAPAYTFPRVHVKIVKCEMSKNQAKWYANQVAVEKSVHGTKELEMPKNFYIGTRMRANIALPSGQKDDRGLRELTADKVRMLENYSCKFVKLVKRLTRDGLALVYSGFVGAAGIAAITTILDILGWKNFLTDGPGAKRYAVFSGDTTSRQKDLIRATFNDSSNDDAQKIRVIIGSPSIKEGVSLMRIESVHIMEAYWNHSRLAQIYARAVRYCSHKSLPKASRAVTIYIYCAWTKKPLPTPDNSIDLYMLAIADKKRDQNWPYIQALINCAVDRLIHYPK